jgi:multidrug efflux pump
MTFSKFFIERPIFATVVSCIIVIAGLVAMKALPVAMYPTITPVTVQVTTTYPGADSKTVGDSVAAPIEAQINGVDNMLYMTSSSSSNGQMSLTVYFSLNTDPDIAQVQVQNRVSLAEPQLPSAVVQQGVSVQKKSSSIMMLIAVLSKTGRYSDLYVSNYANVYVLDAIKRVEGAGQAQILGVADQAMRIWMSPTGWPPSASPRATSSRPSRTRTPSSERARSDSAPRTAPWNRRFPWSPSGPSPKPASMKTSSCAPRRTEAPSCA